MKNTKLLYYILSAFFVLLLLCNLLMIYLFKSHRLDYLMFNKSIDTICYEFRKQVLEGKLDEGKTKSQYGFCFEDDMKELSPKYR